MEIAGVNAEATQPLVGETKTVFSYGKPEDFGASVEQARADQEELVGVPMQLKVGSMRQTHMIDAQGRDVYEVFATFEPVPQPAPPPEELHHETV